MSIEQYLIFLSISFLFFLTPGPSILLCINNGAKYGVKRSAIGVLGNVIGFLSLLMLSSFGLGAIITASSEFFNVLKVIGAIYLIYLGVKIWFSPIYSLNGDLSTEEFTTPFALFKKSLFVTLSNPKAIVYVTALLPQFINTKQDLTAQIVTIALTSAVVHFVIFMSYVALANRAKRLLQQTENRKKFNRFTGFTFVGFGIALGLTENKT